MGEKLDRRYAKLSFGSRPIIFIHGDICNCKYVLIGYMHIGYVVESAVHMAVLCSLLGQFKMKVWAIALMVNLRKTNCGLITRSALHF